VQPDLLQQLRDLHLPVEPIWWPPAPGWWLLAAAAGAVLVWICRQVMEARRKRQPFKRARALYDRLWQSYQADQLTAREYLHQSNELLKRLVIFGIGQDQARKANDQDWLDLLDQLIGSNEFSAGPGRQLGNQRFSPEPETDVDALHQLLSRFFRSARP
jgi:hypothetical protein